MQQSALNAENERTKSKLQLVNREREARVLTNQRAWSSNSLLAQSHNTPLLPSKNFCITIVCNFSWEMKMSQEKSKTMPMQIFFWEGGGGGKRGVLWDLCK